MNRSFPKPLRTTFVVIAVLVAISAAVALAFLGVAQWLPEEFGNGRIQWDDHSIALSNAFSGGLLDFMFAFGLATLAVLIAIAATIFGVAVAVMSLTVVAGVLALVALVMGFPFLLIVGIVWLIVRHNKRQVAMPSAGPTTSAQA